MSRISEYISRVDSAIESANNGKSKLSSIQLNVLEGMSSKKNRILLSELVKDGDRYLEIGVYRGSTFASANYKKNLQKSIAIDNFSQFDDGKNIVKFARAMELSLVTNYTLFNADCFNLPKDMISMVAADVNVYFYDGDHREIDHEMALTYYKDKLANQFIFIVDDWNDVSVRAGTNTGFIKTGLKIHRSWGLGSSFNGDIESWWNGIGIFVCEKR